MRVSGAPPWGMMPGEAEQESSKRQQCVRATELAERTGLIRYAGLWISGRMPHPGKEPEMKNSGKDFDESGRKTVVEVPGFCMPYMLQRRFYTKERRVNHNEGK